jgi:hypothetical protein
MGVPVGGPFVTGDAADRPFGGTLHPRRIRLGLDAVAKALRIVEPFAWAMSASSLSEKPSESTAG